MICPKCKKQIPKETINCPHCGVKIGTICKHCGSYNLVYNKSCIECGTELVKFCTKCKSANFPNAKTCRKCGEPFKQKKVNANSKKDLTPPRQFVLPELSKNKIKLNKQTSQPLKRALAPIPQNKIINVNPLSEINDGSPIRPKKELLKSDAKMLSEKKSTKKVSESSKQVNTKKKIIKIRKKNNNSENEALQTQLTSLQEQLNGLQQQLKVLPQQLNSMNIQQAPEENSKNADNKKIAKDNSSKKTEEQKVIKNVQKSIQKSVLPNVKIQKDSKNSGKIQNGYKGILPYKANILPNRKNVISNPRTIQQPKNHLTEAISKQFKITEPKPEAKAKKVVSNLPHYSPNLFTQASAKNILVNTLLNTSVSIISLSGGQGIGKNIVLKATIDELKENQFVWLVGKATQLSQITPCGLFQDILLTFFNVPNFCVNTSKLRKDSIKFFKTEFSTLKNDEIDDLINFLYPEKTAYYENIFKNKARTFTILRKVFETISSRMQTVFVIDNFEQIDNMSYEFLKTLINTQSGLQNTKFILTYNEPRSVKTYLYDNTLTDSSYADIALTNFNESQTEAFINQYTPLFIGTSQSMKDAIHTQTNGNPAYIEQILNLITDSSRNYVSFYLPETFVDVVKRRLDLLKNENSTVYELLIASAVLGLKFYPVVLNQLFKVDEKTFVELFSSLIDLNYIIPVNESAYEFKSTMLWKTILEIAKRDRNFMNINEKLFVILSNLTLSSHSSLALIATNLKENLSALNAWSEVVRQTAAIGDENIYIMAQKYSLLLVDKLQGLNSKLIRQNIFERLGKVLSFSNPKAAIEYLPKVIEHARKLEDNLKEFELTAYLAQCCHEVGNHFGVIECIDSAAANIDQSYDLEIAMIKSRKLDTLLTIGNLGEVVDLIEREILPVFERNLDTTKPHKNIKIEDLFEAWLDAYLILAKSLVLQGDNRALGIITTIFEIIEKNNIQNELYICKVKLILALSNTLKGEIQESELILDETLRLYKNNDVMDKNAITDWNMISVINSILRNNFEGIQDELFQIVTFANNNNDQFSKNILKLFLGKVLKEKGKFKQALSIYSEQVSYFAKDKNALGVLLSWYFISEVTLITSGPEKSLEYSLKALEIAQSPKIQNFYFITQFNKIISEAYLALQDFDSAKVYIESAIGIARQFDLLDILSELYFLYGKYLQELSTIKSDSQSDYAISTIKMFDKAAQASKSLKNDTLFNTILQADAEFRLYCQKNDISLK